jgi:hypothetical protein
MGAPKSDQMRGLPWTDLSDDSPLKREARRCGNGLSGIDRGGQFPDRPSRRMFQIDPARPAASHREHATVSNRFANHHTSPPATQ